MDDCNGGKSDSGDVVIGGGDDGNDGEVGGDGDVGRDGDVGVDGVDGGVGVSAQEEGQPSGE